jgi:hypothetical protein
LAIIKPSTPAISSKNHPPTKPSVAGGPMVRKAKLGFFEPFFDSISFLKPQYWFFWLLSFVAAVLGGIIPIVLIGPMYCGLGLCFLAKERGDLVHFDLLFKGFDHFVAALIPVLIYMAISLAIIPVILVGVFGMLALVASGSTAALIIGIVIFVIAYVVSIVYMMVLSYGIFFSSFLVAEYQLEGMDAFKVSFAGLKMNWPGLFAVALAGAILTIAGALLCYIPLILMVPMLFGGPFLCYRKIFSPSGNGAIPGPVPNVKPSF